MYKVLLLALALPLCSCQLLLNGLGLRGLGGSGGNVVSLGGTQYLLLPLGAAQSISPVALPRPAPIQISQPVAPVVLPQPRPVALVGNGETYGPPEPYNFGYQYTDEFGTTASRQETSDGNAVRGSYAYTDAQGLRRVVEYVADAGGFRAAVSTNEPGTANANPADVQITAEEPPPQVVAAYLTPQVVRRLK